MIIAMSFTTLSFADTDQNIKIQLQHNGSAKVTYAKNSFDISYLRYNDQILIGKAESQDLIKLLHLASDLSGQKIDLALRHRAWTDTIENTKLPSYDVILVGYMGPVGRYGITQFYTSSKFNVTKVLEFYSGGVRQDGMPYDFFGTEYATPHVLFNNGEYEYYLPLRYIFEQLGFSVVYANNSGAETIQISYAVR